MRLFWVAAALLALCAPSSALFGTLINASPTLAKMLMFGLGTMGPTFFTTSLVYFLGRHFGFREIRPKFRKPAKPGDRLDYAGQIGPQHGSSYAYYAPEESQYAPQNGPYAPQNGQFAYVEGRSVAEGADELGQEVREEAPSDYAAAPEWFTHPRGRKVVSRP